MKRLIVCFDGTWNAADGGESETNVSRIARAIHGTRETDKMQLVLYLRGVGTTGTWTDKMVGGAIGHGIGDIIRSAYMFLCQNYVPAHNGLEADEIFLFGFSRGAFAARSLGGMIGACGLLKRQSLGRVSDAWTFYRTATERKPPIFKQATGIDTHEEVAINFLGVWDTVGALGIPLSVLGDIFTWFGAGNHGFHNTEPSAIIKHGAHALAVDEFRDEYVPTWWTGESPNDCKIEQVWFPGAHSDIGGGYDSRGAADISLRWMAKRAASNGLVIDWSCLPAKADPLAPIHEARHGYSIKDRLTPTFRAICNREFKVGPHERRHMAVDLDEKRVAPIGEAIHESLVQRWGQETGVFPAANRSPETAAYRPRNLAPLFTPAGKLRADTPVARDD